MLLSRRSGTVHFARRVLAAKRVAGVGLALLATPALVTADPDPRPHSHGGDLGVPEMSEAELRRFETATLGPGHAAEHARARAAQSEGRLPETAQAWPSGGPPTARAAAAGPPELVGRWGASFPIPVIGIHAAMLPTGKVMWFSYPRNPSPPEGAPNTTQAWLWDPANGQAKRVDPPLWRDPADGQLKPANIWCAGQTFTHDGRLVVFGGNLSYSSTGSNGDFKGLNKAYTFNPFNETWTEQPAMRHGRWYPTGVRLADGRIVIMDGLDESGAGDSHNNQVELFTPSRGRDGRGRMTLLGSRGGPGRPPGGGLYPHMFAMPSGRVLVAGPAPRDTWFMNDPGYGLAWSDATNFARRLFGTAVLMPDGPRGRTSTRVMQLGGSGEPVTPTDRTTIAVATTETFDESDPRARWRASPSMHVGRGHHNTVLLPDGSMVTVGGGVGLRNGDLWAGDPEQRQVELWDPLTGTWRLGPSQTETRAYHSTALLLPDGRVISAGDDFNGGLDRDTAEIYSPPYLFGGERPTISSAPSKIRAGRSFDVNTPHTDITRASLVAPGATTHATDMNQRYIELSVRGRPGGVTVTPPRDANAATPGYHMLFLINSRGVPSVARWVRLTAQGDLRAPALGFRAKGGFNARRGTISGTVSDLSGVRNVRLALAERAGGLCRWWSAEAQRPAARAASCAKQRWLKARLTRLGAGRYRWRVTLGKRPPPGSYRLYLRAVDTKNNIAARLADGRARIALRVGRGRS